MEIKNSTTADFKHIFELYDAAMSFQKTVFDKQWQGFSPSLIEQEIAENRQWKIIVDGEIACIFAITFEDVAIWGDKCQSDAIYIHRIVTNPAFRGGHYVRHIVAWAKEYAPSVGRKFVRMDTWGDNEKLIAYYQQCGFDFLGIVTPDYRSLPKHYEGITLSLFEIELDEQKGVE
jgi:ribosomal protein S18 acetylase RimI-like enzyme